MNARTGKAAVVAGLAAALCGCATASPHASVAALSPRPLSLAPRCNGNKVERWLPKAGCSAAPCELVAAVEDCGQGSCDRAKARCVAPAVAQPANPKNEIELTFIPEFGEIIADRKNIVFVRAKTADGWPLEIVGELRSASGAGIPMKTNQDGRGILEFVPQQGVEYFVVLEQPVRLVTSAALPTVVAYRPPAVENDEISEREFRAAQPREVARRHSHRSTGAEVALGVGEIVVRIALGLLTLGLAH